MKVELIYRNNKSEVINNVKVAQVNESIYIITKNNGDRVIVPFDIIHQIIEEKDKSGVVNITGWHTNKLGKDK